MMRLFGLWLTNLWSTLSTFCFKSLACCCLCKESFLEERENSILCICLSFCIPFFVTKSIILYFFIISGDANASIDTLKGKRQISLFRFSPWSPFALLHVDFNVETLKSWVYDMAVFYHFMNFSFGFLYSMKKTLTFVSILLDFCLFLGWVSVTAALFFGIMISLTFLFVFSNSVVEFFLLFEKLKYLV